MVEDMPALMPMRILDSAARRRAMRRSRNTKPGITSRASKVTFQLRMSIAVRVAARVKRLEATLATVVTLCWAPSTSLVSRLSNAPVWVWVKKATGMRWTWP
jgi:hypothetical protein